MFLSKIVISTHHVYTYKYGGEPATYREVMYNGNIRLLMSQNVVFFFLFGAGLFLFQLLSELCFPTWLFAFSKVIFKFSDQASMNYRYPHVASVRLLFFVSIHSYYRDQRRIGCRLVMLYKVTYDLIAIPASDYLTPNRRQSRHIHTLTYRQIPTLKNYDKYTFFPRTIIHWNALLAFIPLLPTFAQFSNAVCQVVHLSP